ncbi:winged helix-turn-helix transcriptional regulator [Sulfolobus acidocaldarius]|uniref:Conserved conjugative plasmid protein n=4 Tax=Sulfolobus acidocaldarius TaxID=2285 RepID=Q4JBD4_SULAC|nr:winged helix-turn-helix transcriptional regulator [Sulfolobus acidocaldarius]AAY79895.1 conserved conjugative plasmid protein [Sulfolobus acidocaldarius DSM 639]AGE70459.1 conjugative plasmid protein [Sulfolobus acidocaldarius N8]AGE72733.1 conjugative plasmid protein [Sulfolobus acidocaldarius Ron12/I]ALU29161.1 conjugal transfer protein [Sulfolobus acidocaldarius]ALU31886.1 conjugal transfer protein [Sulfolobus acidocaldarius]
MSRLVIEMSIRHKELSEIEQRVLRFLLKNDGTALSDIIEKTRSSPNSVTSALRELIEVGLVEERREEVFPRRRFLYLTGKGKVVAKKLDEIYSLLEN